MRRETFRAVFLAAIMVLSVVAMGAAFAGGAAGQVGSGDTYVVSGEQSDADFDTIDAALSSDDVGTNDVLQLQAETYAPSNQLTIDSDNLTIVGAGVGETVIQSSSDGYGFHVRSENVSLSGFTLEGPNEGARANYGIKVDAGAINDGRLDGFSIENVAVTGSERTGLDLNAVTNADVDSVTVSDAESGTGVAFTDVTNSEVTEVTTNNNAWGGVAIFADGALSDQLGADVGSYGIEFTDELDANEPVPLYEQASADSLITRIDYPTNFQYRVAADTSAKLSSGNVAGEYDWYYTSESTALTAAAATNADTGTEAAYVSELDGPFVVNESLSIQAAVDTAEDGDSIAVLSGVYDEQVIVDRASVSGLTIDAVQRSKETTITYNGTLNQPTLVVESENVTVSGFTIERVTQEGESKLISQAARVAGANITLADNEYVATTGGQPGDAVGLYVSARSANPTDGELAGKPVSVTIDGGEIRNSDVGLAVESDTENFAASSVSVSIEDTPAFRNNEIQIVEFGGNEDVLNSGTLVSGERIDLDTGAVSTNPSDIELGGFGPFPVDALIMSEIQQALDNTNGNATVELADGTYNEEVSVDTLNISLVGQGNDTVINGSAALDADKTELSDVRVQSSIGGVFPNPADENNAINVGGTDVTVSNVTVDLTTRSAKWVEALGIEVYGDDASATITNVTVAGTGEMTGDELVAVVGVSADSGAEAMVHESDIDVESDGYSFAVVARDGATTEVRYNELSANGGVLDGVGFGIEGAAAADQTVRFNEFDGVDTIEHKSDGGTLDVTGNYWNNLDDVEFIVENGGEIVYDPFLTVEPDEVDADSLGDTTDFGHDLVVPADGEAHAVAFPASVEGTVDDVFGEFNGTVYAYDGDEWESGEEIADEDVGALDAFAVSVDEGEDDLRIAFEYADDESAVPSMTTAELEEGWNFVGAPQSGPSDDAFAAATADVTTVVDVIPGSDSQMTPYGLDASGEVTNPSDVSPFKGYWVFVTDDGELGATVPVAPTQQNEEAALKRQ